MIELIQRGYDHLRNKGVNNFIILTYEYMDRRVRFALWNRLGIGQFEELYDAEYYNRYLNENQLSDAKIFNDAIQNEFDPKSVIDFGCGAGRFLISYDKQGIPVLGIDNHKQALKTSPLEDGKLEKHNFQKPYYPDKKYDVAYCIETLEHIPDECSDIVISSINRSASTAIITAATPGQRGTLHINEMPRKEWIDRFESHGFTYKNEITESIRESIEVEADYLTENLMTFESPEE